MKKVKFGRADSEYPMPGWEKLALSDQKKIFHAECYGFVEDNFNSYIVAKTYDDDESLSPELLGKFIVRPAIADMYKDGSGMIYLDQEESLVSQRLETYLNHSKIRDKIKSIDDVSFWCDGICKTSNKVFKFLTMDSDTIMTTSIIHEAFERKKKALEECRGSFSDLQYELNMMNNNHHRR